ncbi:MAG: hypothetical protein QF578_03985 [Alphaproteobacteria bacterium]|jgi:hypothetical protein|nr:hypothetical protein [Alphaproteobacteria bacterium]MDP6815326.1 hypothetical protein [Alphaproteobacteria bacterium]
MPEKQWIFSRCRHCGREVCLEFADDRVASGGLAGGPGVYFDATSSETAHGLYADWSDDGVRLCLETAGSESQEWRIGRLATDRFEPGARNRSWFDETGGIELFQVHQAGDLGLYHCRISIDGAVRLQGLLADYFYTRDQPAYRLLKQVSSMAEACAPPPQVIQLAERALREFGGS